METLNNSNSLISNPTFLLLLLFLCLILRLLFRKNRRNLNLPPGPKPWPVIGNLNLMGPLPHQSIHSLSQKYGPIMQLQFGSFPVVVGSTVEMAKYFLRTNDVNFATRPITSSGKYTTYGCSDIVWAPYGTYWRQARKIFLVDLFSPKRLDSFEYIRVEETKAFLHGLYKSCGMPTTLRDHLASISLNVISRMALGKNYTEKSENVIMASEEFKGMIDELFLLNGVLNIGDFIPWLEFLDLQGYVKRMKNLMKKLDRFYEHVLDEHEDRRRLLKDEEYVARDMVDLLLQLAEDPNLDAKLERDQVKALIQDLLAGGTESSAIMLEWAMSELMKKPEIIHKATEELKRVIGRNRLVEEKDMVNLPYINAILKETMRLHPVSPMLAPRLAIEDCKVNGYDIPKNTRLFVNTWTIGRDPEVWKNPNEFCPQRFIENGDIDAKGQNFEFLPFGAGRRMCPGYSLGLKVIQSSLANLLHCFEWKLKGDMKNKDLNMEEVFGLSTPRKVPLVVVPRPRLPLDVYAM